MSRSAAILVHTTSHAIRAERVLRRAGLQAKLIPTPRHLSSDCGSALRISAEEIPACEEALRKSSVEIDRIVVLD